MNLHTDAKALRTVIRFPGETCRRYAAAKSNVFALFQMTFASITVALVLGSIVDGIKFSSWIVFTVFWVTLVYCPIAHWVWGSRW